MIKKTISSILVALHIFTFGHINDALAILASSASYKLDTASTNIGSKDGRVTGSPSYTRFLMHADGTAGSTNFIDEAGHALTATGNAKIDTAQYKFGASSASFSNQGPTDDSNSKLLMHFDGANNSTVFTDEKGHSFTGFGNARIDTAKSKFGGSSVAFDGSGDYLTTPDSTDWDIWNGDCTIDFWMNLNSLSQNCVLVSQYNTATVDMWQAYMEWTTKRLYIYIYTGAVERAWYYVDFSDINFNTWYHIAIERSGSSCLMFINGMARTVTAAIPFKPGIGDISGPLDVGFDRYANNSFCNGNIDELRISKGVARWTSNFTVPSSPYSNSSVSSTLTSPDSDDWNFANGDFTIDFWLRTPDITAGGSLISQFATPAGNRAFEIGYRYQYSQYWIDFSYTSDGTNILGSGNTWNWTPSNNTWYHIAIVRNGANLKLYINGVVHSNTVDMGTNTIYNSTENLGIGCRIDNPAIAFTGWLDEIRISNGAARWTANFTPPAAPYTVTDGDSQGTPNNTIKDIMGESSIGKTQSSNYKLNAGYLYIIQSNPPEQTQTIPNQSWNKNQSLPGAFDLDNYFMSPDGLALTYSATGPANIAVSIEQGTNIVSFSQPANWSGTETVRFTATDSENNSATSNPVSLQVVNVNNPPVLDFIPDVTVDENQLVTITPHATDVDGGVINYSFTSPLNSSGQWQTNYTSAGTYTVTVTATDPGGLTDTQDVRIIVRNVNRAPVITKINGITVTTGQPVTLPNINEGQTLQITPLATDADNETVLFGYSSGTAAIDSTGKWQIEYDKAGAHTITVTASDNIATVSQVVNVTVVNVNRAPVQTVALSKYTVAPNESFDIMLTASDPDNDSMTYIIKKDTTQIASGAITGNVTVSTSFSAVGDHKIIAIVTDSAGLPTTTDVDVDVFDPNANRDSVNPVMGDFNGDALSDLGLHNSDTGTWEICLSNRGTFTAALDWKTGFGTSKDWWPIGGDFNADGLTDIGIYNINTGELKTALSNGAGFNDPQTALTFANASYSWVPVTGNFNGDKYTDFAVYNTETGEWKISTGASGSFGAFTTWVASFGGTGYSPLTGDFNADGLTDIAIFKKSAGEIKIAFSNTTSFIVQQNNWITNYAVDKDLLIADFNNDGLTDIGYFDKNTGKWYYAVNATGSFIDSGLWIENFGSSSVESGHTADFNGDGITDAATFDKDQSGINRWQVKLSGKHPTDLLVEIDNGTGGKTNITYTYAAEYTNQLLPFPVYVVSQISMIDTLPANQPIETYTQNFEYEGGWFDTVEREFRGFRKIKATDPITNNFTETYFFQGNPSAPYNEDGALKGQIKEIRAYDGTGKLISQAVNTWEVRKAGPSDGVLGFPYLKEVIQTVYEYGQTDPLSTKNQFTYDNLGNIITETCLGDINITGDEKSTQTVYSLGYETGHNRPLEISLKDKDNNLVNKKTFEYYENGNLKKETAYLDGVNDPSTQYGYDSFGNVTSTTNAENHTVLTDYETTLYTYPETITNELGHTIHYEYNYKLGVVTRLTDVNSQTTETIYDSLGRITAQKNTQAQIVTTYQYPDFNTKKTMQLGLTKIEYVDGIGRIYKSVSDGEDGAQKRQISSEIYFNNRGLKDKESLPHYIDEAIDQISYISYTYDLRGRIKTTTSDFPGVVKDATSNIDYITPLYVETQDPRGKRKGTQKDVYGNAIEIIEFTQEGTYHTYYEYDLKGNLTKLTDSKGNITQIQYDRLGRKTSLNDPDTGITTYTYDKLGNLITQTDNKLQTITMEYDEISRLKFKRSGSTVLATYDYDDAAKTNCLGRLSKVTDQSSNITSYYYDTEGRAYKVDKTIDSTTYTTQTAYDLIGRTTSITYPDNTAINYTYDSNSGLLEKVNGQGAGGITYVNDIVYNAKGQIRTIAYGNSVTTTYAYGQDLRLSSILTQKQGSSPLQNLNYDFDKNGNIIQLTDNLRSNIRAYTYDDLNRLTTADNTPDPSGGYTTYNYQYDSIGNMTQKEGMLLTYNPTASPITQQGQTPNIPHAVRTAGSNNYTYDLNGNMRTSPSKLMSYDIENRMISVETSTETTNFTYDVDGSRIKKQTGTNTITYIGSLFEKDQTGKTTKHIFAGANRVCSIESTGSTYYYHSDHLGSSNIISDSTGAQVQHCEYTPYGTTARNEGTDVVTHKFTGKELDSTGLYFYAWRYYDPTIGRFIQPDTIIPEPYNPQTLNRYSYCDNNPLNYTDPSGHFAWFVAAIIGAIIGGIMGGISAAQQGGNVFAGILVGAIVGAISAVAMAGAAQYAQGLSFGSRVGLMSLMGGATGAANGAATGWAGGAGSGSGILRSAGWGGLIGLGMGAISGAMMGGSNSTPVTDATRDVKAVNNATHAYADALIKGGDTEILKNTAQTLVDNSTMVPLDTGRFLSESSGILGGIGLEAASDINMKLVGSLNLTPVNVVARSANIVARTSGLVSKALGVVDFTKHLGITASNLHAGAGGWQFMHDVALVSSDAIGFGQGPLRLIPALAQATDLASQYYANLLYGVQ